jgi:hypothetical protein
VDGLCIPSWRTGALCEYGHSVQHHAAGATLGRGLHEPATPSDRAEHQQHEQRPDDTADETGGVKIEGAFPANKTPEKTADERTDHTEERRGNKAHRLPSGHDGAGNKARQDSDNDECDDGQANTKSNTWAMLRFAKSCAASRKQRATSLPFVRRDSR